MTEEQERLLHAVHAICVESASKLDGLCNRFSDHEDDDAAAYERLTKLETDRTRLFACYAAAAVIVPAVVWVLTAVHGCGG